MLYFLGSCLFLYVLFFFASWLFQKLKGGVAEENEKAMPELELDNNTPQVKYDVFVSFRGEDVRYEFLSHLTEAFQREKIKTFVDDKNLKKGEEIWASLVAAIEGSSISLIIFSPDYASSRWCLNELVKILECKVKYGHIVIPVFYHVEPTHVRHQSGTYKKAFAEHGKKHKTEVQLWINALTISANLSGIQSSKFRNDAEMVKEIVNHVLKMLTKPPPNVKGLVGIEEKIATIESLIRKEPKDTILIGIWGMGGIGKTTLAKEIFNKLQPEYEEYYFLANEREDSKKYGILSLKEKLFSGLLRRDVKISTPNLLPEDIVRRIRQTKVFVVLDDLEDFDHQEKILGSLHDFGRGSRILVTTRDKQVLNKANEIYSLEELSSHEALDLFISKAFNPGDHEMVDKELIESMVKYAQGIPLNVKVLAGLLCGKSKEEWESLLHKLKRMPLTEIYKVMKLSYDSLDRKGQQIFLDLACFFLRTYNRINVGNLKCLLKDDESDYSIAFELGRLEDKALITISRDNILSMHDSLQEMAWEIVRQESIEDPGSRSRLWDANDVLKALQIGKVTEAIRSIIIDFKAIKEIELMHDIFAKMSRFKFLEIFGHDDDDIQDITAAEGFQFLISELRYLYWENYPLKSLPGNFLAEKLVILKLICSRIEKLWDGVKNLVNLKEVDLSCSHKLVELPDFSKAINLEVLIVEYCSRLTTVHPSIFSLPKLQILKLNYCKSFYFDLSVCYNLMSETLIELRLANTEVKEFPLLFGLQSKLKLLDLHESQIESLPSTLSNLKELQSLNIGCCKMLQIISELPPSLEILNASACTSLQSICKLSQCLKTLDVRGCSSIKTLPEVPSSLETLNVIGCSSIKALPEVPQSLNTLDVGQCDSLQSLPKLPSSLNTLDVRECRSLQSLPELPMSLETLDVSGCQSLQSLPELPQLLKFLHINWCTSLQSLPKLPVSLETLNATGCESLKIVLFPSTIVEQLKENKNRVFFELCSNLDEHSLKAIELNAQLNMVKFAQRRLSAQDDHEAIYAYPGSSVPEWFKYKTTNDYIIIDDLSFVASSPVMGFIFCVVFHKHPYLPPHHVYDIEISISGGEGKGDTFEIEHFWADESDQVYLINNEFCSDFLISAEDLTRFEIHVTTYRSISGEQCQDLVNGFGVTPISTSTYDNLVQQMKLRDSAPSVPKKTVVKWTIYT